MGLFRKRKKEDATSIPGTSAPRPAPEEGRAADKEGNKKDIVQDATPKAEAAESVSQAKSDTSERSVIEEQVHTKSQDRSLYRTLLDGLYDAILILDEKGVIIGSNARAVKLFGYSEADLWNTPCSQLIASMQPAVLYKVFEHAESGRFSVVNASCTRKDGTTFPAEIAMNLIDFLSKGNLILSIRNIERRVRGQNRRSRDLVLTDALATAVVSCRSDGMILSVNPAFLRLSGIQNQKDVVHHFIGEFCASNEVGVQLLLKNQPEGAHWVGEIQFLGAGSRKVHVIATTVRFKHDDSEQLAITFTPLPRRAAIVPQTETSSQIG